MARTKEAIVANDVGEGSSSDDGTSAVVTAQTSEEAVAWVNEAIDGVVELRERCAASGSIFYSLAQVEQILHELEGGLRERREELISHLEGVREGVKARSSQRAAETSLEVVDVLLCVEDELRKARHPATATSFDGPWVAYLLTKIDLMRCT